MPLVNQGSSNTNDLVIQSDIKTHAISISVSHWDVMKPLFSSKPSAPIIILFLY